MEGRGWQGPVLAMEKREKQAGNEEIQCPGLPSLPYSPLQKWELGPWTLDSQLSLRKKDPSPLLGLHGFGVAVLPDVSRRGTRTPALGPSRCAPLQLTKPLSSFIQSSGTYWRLSQCQVLGRAATLSSLWSPLIRQSHLAQGPPQALSPHTGQLPVEHECDCPFYLHVFRVMPSPDRHDVCFAHRYGSGTILPVDRDPTRGPN